MTTGYTSSGTVYPEIRCVRRLVVGVSAYDSLARCLRPGGYASLYLHDQRTRSPRDHGE